MSTPLAQSSIPPVFRMQDLNSHDLYEITLQELQLFLSFLKFSSVEYVKFCVDRINKVSHSPTALFNARLKKCIFIRDLPFSHFL